MLERIDMFGANLPMFNIEGRQKVSSVTGAICTIMLMCIFLMYASLKLVQMITKHNPQISELIETNFYSSDDNSVERINLDEIGFNLAFSVEGRKDRVRKDDAKYVKYVVRA